MCASKPSYYSVLVVLRAVACVPAWRLLAAATGKQTRKKLKELAREGRDKGEDALASALQAGKKAYREARED